MPQKIKHVEISGSGKGMNIEILFCTRNNTRYKEMRAWLQENKPDLSIAEYSVHSEPGNSKWLETNRRFHQTSLPQVILVHKKTRMHFSDVHELMDFFPKPLQVVRTSCTT